MNTKSRQVGRWAGGQVGKRAGRQVGRIRHQGQELMLVSGSLEDTQGWW